MLSMKGDCMSLRGSKTFRAVAYLLVGLAIFSGIAAIVQRALSAGGWNEAYRSSTLKPWTNGGALILFAFMALIGLVWLFFFLQRRWREQQDARRLKVQRNRTPAA
ncbi:MAG: hypothetical protein ABW171_06695 [Steroidobacter sp.]